jgi:phage-related protein
MLGIVGARVNGEGYSEDRAKGVNRMSKQQVVTVKTLFLCCS